MSYFDRKGNIRVELLDRDASEQANKFVVRFRDRNGREQIDRKKTLSSSQLRKFFNEFRQLEKKIDTEGFERVKPLIKMVKSKASYASNPSKPKIPKSFRDFLVSNVNKISAKDDFQAFILYFEAVVGFFYGIEGVKND